MQLRRTTHNANQLTRGRLIELELTVINIKTLARVCPGDQLHEIGWPF